MTEAQEYGSPSPRGWFFLLLLAVLPLFAIHFGSGNQIEQLSIIARIADPGFAAGDVFLDDAARPGQPRYYYSAAIAGLSALAPVHVVIHTLSVLTSLGLGALTWFAARRYFGCSEPGAAVASLLAVLNHGFSLGLSGYLVFESYQPASAAVPLSLLGFVLLIEGRTLSAAMPFVLGVLIHPTLGAEVAALSYGAAGVMALTATDRWVRVARLAASMALFVVAAGCAWVIPNLGSGGVRMTNAEFMAILPKFRAPHHYFGLDFPRRRWADAIAFVAVTGALFVAIARSAPGRGKAIAPFAVMSAATMVLMALSLYFVDIAESRLWATAQIFRMTLVLKWAGFLAFGWLAGRWISDGGPTRVVLVGVAIIPSVDAQVYGLLSALAAWAVIHSLRLSGWRAWIPVVIAIGVAAWQQRGLGGHDMSARLAVGSLALVLILLVPRKMIGAIAAVALVAAFMVLGYANRLDGVLGSRQLSAAYSPTDIHGDEAALARVAAAVSPPGSVWLIPPEWGAFRLLSGRPVVVDFKAIPFSDQAMRDWRERLEVLYGPVSGAGFVAQSRMSRAHTSGPALEAARDHYGASFAVISVGTPWDGQVLGQAESYRAVPIPP